MQLATSRRLGEWVLFSIAIFIISSCLKGSEDEHAKVVVFSDENGASGVTKAPEAMKIAVMISGQQSRFSYKEGLDLLAPKALRYLFEGGFRKIDNGTEIGINREGNQTRLPSRRVQIDVFVTLQQGSIGAKNWAGVRPLQPPYEEGAFSTETIRKFYIGHGADYVQVKHVASEEIEKDLSSFKGAMLEKHGQKWWNTHMDASKFNKYGNP